MEVEDELNFFRLTKSVYSHVNDALRYVFLEEWRSIYNTPWTNDHPSGQLIIDKEKESEKKFKRRSKLFRQRYVHILTLISYGNVQTWDSATLFFVLLQSHAIKLQDPDKGWRPKPMRSAPLVKGEYIDELKEIRDNFIAHNWEAKISQDDYKNTSGRIRAALVGLLGESHDVLNNFDQLFSHKYFPSHSETLKLRSEISDEAENLRLLDEQLDEVENEISGLEELIDVGLDSWKQSPLTSIQHNSNQEIVDDKKEDENDRLSGLVSRVESVCCHLDRIISQHNDLSHFKSVLGEESDHFLKNNDWEGFQNYIDDKLKCCGIPDTELLVKMELAKGLCCRGDLEDALQLLTSLISSAHLTRQGIVYVGEIYHLKSVAYKQMNNEDEARRYGELAKNILGFHKASDGSS